MHRASLNLARWVFDRTIGSIRDPRTLRRVGEGLTRLTHAVNGRLRQRVADAAPLPEMRSHDGRERLRALVLRPDAPWRSVEAPRNGTPGMITDEERRYYAYLGRFYSGRGEVVELGPWLGCSTSHIVQGLRGNPNFSGRRLRVFDDFVWRASWMNGFVPEAERPRNHEDFRHLFDKYSGGLSESLTVEKRRILPYDGNEGVPQLAWTGEPVEMIFVDCGRLFLTNDAWYRIFSSSFIPGVTLIAMQDWRLQFQVPVYWENQTKNFTDSKGASLQLIHELKDGTTATFLYLGERPAPALP